MLTKHDPEPWLVNELINASSVKLPRMEIGDLMILAQVKRGLRGFQNSCASARYGTVWFGTVCHGTMQYSEAMVNTGDVQCSTVACRAGPCRAAQCWCLVQYLHLPRTMLLTGTFTITVCHYLFSPGHFWVQLPARSLQPGVPFLAALD